MLKLALIQDLTQRTHYSRVLIDRHVLDMLIGEHLALLKLQGGTIGTEQVILFELVLLVLFLVLLISNKVVWPPMPIFEVLGHDRLSDHRWLSARIPTVRIRISSKLSLLLHYNFLNRTAFDASQSLALAVCAVL